MRTQGTNTPAVDRGTRSIERFLPEAYVRERFETLVHAPADQVFETALRFDLRSVPLIGAIFWLRTKILGGAPLPADRPRSFVAETMGLGWKPLVQTPGHELVMGSATRPWEANVRFLSIPPERFSAFAEPDYVKIVWTIEVEPLTPSLSRLATETRVQPTDAVARAKFRRYWLTFGIGILFIRWLGLPAIARAAEAQARARRREPRQ